MTNDEITPELEQGYIVYYSKLSIALGSVMTITALEDIVAFSEKGIILKYGFYACLIISVITALFYLFTGNKFGKMSLSKNAWTGTYRDEFLNSVNLVAYKIAFFVSMSVAMIGVFIANFVDTETLGTSIIGVGFIAYGLTALVQLRESDE